MPYRMPYLSMLKAIYKPKYIVLNIAIALAYFFIIKMLIVIQAKSIFVPGLPSYLIALLSITSAVTMTIAVYSISNTRKNQAKVTATTASVLSVALSSAVGACGCQVSVFASLAGIAIGSSGAFALNVIMAENSLYIIAAIILINIFVSIYYISKLSRPACAMNKGDHGEEAKGQESKS
ncbi:MAG: hypothetical protein QXW10_04370 [Candidatus Micrarchaeaceae archaeon]